jgi:hypothetical protein
LREQWRVLHCSLGRTCPAQPKMSGPVLARSQKNFKKIFSRICDSSAYFYTKFCLILVCIFTSYKYKSGIKIPGFRQNLKKKCFCFHAYVQVSQKKKLHHIFIQQRKIQNKKMF